MAPTLQSALRRPRRRRHGRTQRLSRSVSGPEGHRRQHARRAGSGGCAPDLGWDQHRHGPWLSDEGSGRAGHRHYSSGWPMGASPKNRRAATRSVGKQLGMLPTPATGRRREAARPVAQLAREEHETATPAVENGSGIGRRGVAILGAWTLVAMLFAGQAWFAAQVRGEPLTWARASAIWLVWAAAWAALTPIALRLEARFPLQRPHILAALAVHGVASAICALVNLALFALAAPVIGATQVEPTWLGTVSRLLGTTFLLNLPVYWLIVAAAHVGRLVRTAREKDRRRLRLEAQLADARLQTLRSQLQPHFLFNARQSARLAIDHCANSDSGRQAIASARAGQRPRAPAATRPAAGPGGAPRRRARHASGRRLRTRCNLR
jgi:hypothetical protein